MSKKSIQQSGISILDWVSLALAAFTMIFLIINIQNRLTIINILDKSTSTGVGSDAPVLYVFLAGIVIAGISLFLKRKVSSVWLVAATTLLVCFFAWYFGLGHELENSFQALIP